MTGLQLAACLLLGAPAAALALGFFVLYPRRPSWTHLPILVSCALVSAAAAWIASQVALGRGLDWTLWRWIPMGDFTVEFGVRLDGLSAAVLAMVAVVGALIHVYAVGYMEGDPGFARFFLYFHLFYLSMVGLLVSNNYLQMYVFWEGVGLASYLLIGFWYDKPAARSAALKAFLTNRVGDVGFMLAVLLLWSGAGTLKFDALFGPGGLAALGPRRLTAAAFLLLWAATAKSAQFPLYIWLPDAMEGPTPTSALMHAATMVTAGIFLLARSSALLAAAPAVLPWMTAIGAFTSLGAAVVASVKTDLKRVLAYSTVSHLGLMMLALGLGNAAAAVYHLVIHGFFKAVLFLCAGNVLHALGRPKASIDEVGGLRRALPFTFGAFAAGALSLSGLPPFAGFYSKDQIIDAAFESGGPVLRAAALLIAVLSAFYIFRLLFMVFLGPRSRQKPPAHPHDAGAWMALPTAVLALGAVAAGWFPHVFGGILSGWGGSWGALRSLSGGLSALATGSALAGAALAYAATTAAPEWDWRWKEARPGLAAWIDGDFGWQAFVQAAFVRPTAALAKLTAESFDRDGLDASVEGLAGAVVELAEGGSRLASGLVNDYLWWMLAGTALLAWLSR